MLRVFDFHTAQDAYCSCDITYSSEKDIDL